MAKRKPAPGGNRAAGCGLISGYFYHSPYAPRRKPASVWPVYAPFTPAETSRNGFRPIGGIIAVVMLKLALRLENEGRP